MLSIQMEPGEVHIADQLIGIAFYHNQFQLRQIEPLAADFFHESADEIAFLLAQEESEERLTDAMLRKLAVYRAAIERTLIAPFGSIVLFEAKELQLLGQAILRERVRARADAMLGNG